MSIRMVVLDAATMGFPESEWEPLGRLGELTLYESTGDSVAEVVERIGDAEVVLTNKVPISAEVLQQAPSVRLISVLATGYNVIALDSAREHGVTVCNVPSYSTESVAQHTMALLLALRNHVALHASSVDQGEWIKSPTFSYWLRPFHQLHGQTLGVVGFGEIGRRVAELGRAFGMRVIATSRSQRNPPAWDDFAWVPLDQLFEESDVVTLHCPATPETVGMVNALRLQRMKPHAVLLNTARGNLVEEHALADALRNHRIAGAGLDVVDGEPMRSDCPLRGVPGCVITPHVAWCTVESRRQLLAITEQNIRAFLDGHPRNVVSGS